MAKNAPLTFSPGTILVRETSFVPFFFHYGVGVSENEVIHATLGLGVVNVTLEAFAEGHIVKRSDYSNLCGDPDAVIARARSAIGKWRYRPIDENCEAFILYCLTGERKTRGIQGEILNGLGVIARLWELEPALKSPRRSPYMSPWDKPTTSATGLDEAPTTVDAAVDEPSNRRFGDGETIFNPQAKSEALIRDAQAKAEATLRRVQAKHDARLKNRAK